MFTLITLGIAVLTWWKCRPHSRREDDSKEYFLAGGNLGWIFVAGSITLTNLSTDQLVGMNGNQELLIAWWELAGFVGLLMLAFIFVPIYYKHNCTTTTELLEKKYGGKSIRAVVGSLFLLGNIFIFLPIVLYTGSRFMKSMFGLEAEIIWIALAFALLGSAYAIFGGLRAVAVSDTFSGVGLLAMSLLVVFLSLNAINWDFSGIPAERLTLVGDDESSIPWHTLLTGMILIQLFYWSTNQNITQRAMASKNVREAQKGVLAAAGIRLLIVPLIIAVPGICSYKLYGAVENDGAYGMLVADLMPASLSGAFAAMMAAAVLTTFNSVLNSSAALYVCDIHQPFINKDPHVKTLSTRVSLVFVALALMLVGYYKNADSIINLVQELNGLLSMPILAAFVTGLLFRNVHAGAVMLGVGFGTSLYASFTFGFDLLWAPIGFPEWHYIHLMFINFFCTCAFILLINRLFRSAKSTGLPAS